jgi:hypothetical protein
VIAGGSLEGWRKSSRTHTNHCVELHSGDALVRDTKHRDGGTLRVDLAGLVGFARNWRPAR